MISSNLNMKTLTKFQLVELLIPEILTYLLTYLRTYVFISIIDYVKYFFNLFYHILPVQVLKNKHI